MSDSDRFLPWKINWQINSKLWWIQYPPFILLSMAWAAWVSRTRWRNSSARTEVIGCQLKLGRDGVSSRRWDAAGKLGDDSPALLIRSCLRQFAIKFCNGACMMVPKWSGDCLNMTVRTAITAARKWIFSWTVDMKNRVKSYMKSEVPVFHLLVHATTQVWRAENKWAMICLSLAYLIQNLFSVVWRY